MNKELLLLRRFEDSYIAEPMSGCWLWIGSVNVYGYGQIGETRIKGKKHKTLRAHRLSYEIYRGAIPENLQLDHLCRIRCCVNPFHLEAVTSKENTRRGMLFEVLKAKAKTRTHCRNGHALTPENTYTHKSTRLCRICRRLCDANYRRNYKSYKKIQRSKKMKKTETLLGWLLTMLGGIAIGLLIAAIIACPLLLENSELLWKK